jgi:hypothetical protein
MEQAAIPENVVFMAFSRHGHGGCPKIGQALQRLFSPDVASHKGFPPNCPKMEHRN